MNSPHVLVIGGAGTFGAKLCSALAALKQIPVTVDDLRRGQGERIKFGPLVKVRAQETPRLVLSMKEYKIQHLFHCALPDQPRDFSDLDTLKEDWESCLSVLMAAQQSEALSATLFCPPGARAEALKQLIEDQQKCTKTRLRLLSEGTDESLIQDALQILN